ncbi:hypothetical protein OIU78_001477 [Salix suchowensis]|nr:hypothetical protein OIU78_001477 [Salix suchowensis]
MLITQLEEQVCFWADATARMNYSYFGDTLVFDTSYRTHRYRVPFASFTGINHHGQPVLFGCALILNDSESTFIWLFQTWLRAMSGQRPLSITTDPDRFIQTAVSRVLPETRHRYSKQGIVRETQEKLANIYRSHPMFETEFKKCINETETIDEFESSWQSLLQRYYVMDNEWLQSMYNARQQWVKVYLRDTFFGELSALASWHEKELKADYDTTNTTPVLKTPSPMEKQAAGLYTRRIFMKFQEELVETLANPATKTDDSGTITTYRVAKFGEENKAHIVCFNSLEMKATCSCQMFEHSGIICRHILAVFRAKNVLTLPSQYVLKRWTTNAKSRAEAIKYVEEGAKSIHIYNVAMDALREAANKVADRKNQGSGGAQGGTLTNGSSQELHVAEDNTSATFQSTDEKQRKIRELTAELESTNQRCEVYRANLLAVLKDMEEQKLKLSVKVQNARLSLKE